MLVSDQLHRAMYLPSIPKRIVSLVPSQTELLVDMGLEDCIVGVTKFCVHPESLRKKKTVVGGTKKVNYKEIRALQPDLIICNKEENTQEMVLQLQSIAPVWVSDIYTVQDALVMIQSLGTLLGVSATANKLAETIKNQLLSFQHDMVGATKKKVAYVIWKNPWMVAGKYTFINHLLALQNFENIITSNTSRYPEVSLKILDQADLVLLSTEPFPFKEKDVEALKEALQTEVRLVDGEYFSWYGSRLAKAFDYFKTLS